VISYFALTAITVRALFGQLRVRKQPYRAVYLHTEGVNAESGILCCGGVSHGMLDIQTGAGRKSPAPLRGLKRAQGGGRAEEVAAAAAPASEATSATTPRRSRGRPSGGGITLTLL